MTVKSSKCSPVNNVVSVNHVYSVHEGEDIRGMKLSINQHWINESLLAIFE